MMISKFLWRYRGLLLAVGLLLAFNLVFFFVSPEEIVSYVGVENTYLTLFLIASIGGVNTFTSGVLYASIATFAAGGATPWLLGIAGGLGIAVGDTIMFHLFKYGSASLSEAAQAKFRRFRDTIEQWPTWLQYVAIYGYLGFSPFPNDILMFALAVLRFRFLTILPLIVLGGISVATAVAHLGESWPF